MNQKLLISGLVEHIVLLRLRCVHPNGHTLHASMIRRGVALHSMTLHCITLVYYRIALPCAAFCCVSLLGITCIYRRVYLHKYIYIYTVYKYTLYISLYVHKEREGKREGGRDGWMYVWMDGWMDDQQTREHRHQTYGSITNNGNITGQNGVFVVCNHVILCSSPCRISINMQHWYGPVQCCYHTRSSGWV